MKINYEFVTGTVEVEVSEEWAEVLEELDRAEYNNNHAEKRRHTTLNNGFDEAEWLACEDYEPCYVLEEMENAAKAYSAISELSASQRHLIWNVFIKEMRRKDYAELTGVSPAAVSQQITTIRKNLKKLL